MNRREALKIFAGIGVSALIPFGFSSFFKTDNKETKYIIGFGGAATRILCENSDCLKAETIAVSSSLCGKVLNFIETPNYRQQLSEQEFDGKIILPKQLKTILSEKNNFILFAGLGGATGSHLLLKSAQFLKKRNKTFTIVCSLPFKFEGKRRNYFARNIFNDLQEIQKCKLVDLENIHQQRGSVSVKKAFEIADEQIFSLVG